MKNNNQIQGVDIQSVDSLETYAFNLGLMCVSVQTLIVLQEKAEAIGIFDTDETEASKMLKYQVQRLYTCCDDLLRMCVQRSGQEWDDFRNKLVKQVKSKLSTNSKKAVDIGSKPVAKKKAVKKK